jgi:hypothetical protein
MKPSFGFLRTFVIVVCVSGTTVAEAQTCEQAAAACWELVPVAGGPARIGVYRSHPMTSRHEALTRALVVVHGAERSATTSYNVAIDVARNAGEYGNTLIVAPRFAANLGKACSDEFAENELNWNCDVVLTDWRAGGLAINFEKSLLSTQSMTFLDFSIRRIYFPI